MTEKIDFEKEASWIWCEPKHAGKLMDADFAFSIANLCRSIAARVEEETIKRLAGDDPKFDFVERLYAPKEKP